MVKSPLKWGKGSLNTSSGGKGGKQNKKKQPINEYSDDNSSDGDEHGGWTKIMISWNFHDRNWLVIYGRIKTLEVQLKKATIQQQSTKTQVRMDFQWDGKESIFADTVTNSATHICFPDSSSSNMVGMISIEIVEACCH